MKKLLLLLLFVSGYVHAQQPEPVYSFALVKKPLSWYKEQVIAWKKVIEKRPQDGNAWYNYYYATRNVLRTDPDDKRGHTEKDSVLAELVSNMGKAIPDSYEYNLCMWSIHGFDMTYYPYLEKAFKLGEGRTEHLDFIMNIGEINRDIKQRDEGAIKKLEAGLISPGMLYYNHNVLAGLAPNAILITAGDNDTYPAWVLQAQGFRKDVTVINLSLLIMDQYRDKLYQDLGIPGTKINWESTDESDPDSYTMFQKGLIEHLASNKNKGPVYVALTAMGNKPVVSDIEKQLYLTGLNYLYSLEAIDERALLKKNFEHTYALDYIEYPYYQDISEGLVPYINQNYILPMLKLYDHYKTSGDLTKQNWIRKKLIAVSKGSDSEKAVLQRLD